MRDLEVCKRLKHAKLVAHACGAPLYDVVDKLERALLRPRGLSFLQRRRGLIDHNTSGRF